MCCWHIRQQLQVSRSLVEILQWPSWPSRLSALQGWANGHNHIRPCTDVHGHIMCSKGSAGHQAQQGAFIQVKQAHRVCASGRISARDDRLCTVACCAVKLAGLVAGSLHWVAKQGPASAQECHHLCEMHPRAGKCSEDPRLAVCCLPERIFDAQTLYWMVDLLRWAVAREQQSVRQIC